MKKHLKKLLFLFSFILILLIGATPLTVSSNDNTEFNWYFVSREKNKTPEAPKESASFLNDSNSFYVGDTTKKELYLTFDEGYEKGNTEEILDILKSLNVKAAFFVVKPYITSQANTVTRMVKEGHLVCNHTNTHPSMPSIKDISKFNDEINSVNEAYKSLIGEDMPKFFRPPMGKYSKNSLDKTSQLGYKTIFWSFAYRDWLVNDQPNPEFAIKKIKNGVHPGCIMLLHAVSDTNTKILKDLIISLQQDGYEFKSLNDLPNKMIIE
ncbi:delta-lactam-biosynthetic de-N-acetylase [Clostridium sp. Ade.TY]|uniref:delta-lactam-biosynthetic de-N-acetylase n=1 Tax=Clostridium sp. Ade.TY TaxID=1391647 RepID=UPI0003F8D254|nr:delta-lactam-biosynthetic de-N-acetylase [Clostridium sp. Ade.TY]